MNVFDLQAKIGLDSSDYDRGLSDAEGAFSRVANGIKTGISTIAKVTAAGFTAAAAGVAAISKQAVESYADYEQLVGGVETLFGAQGQSLEEYAAMVGKSVDDAKEQYDKLQQAQEIVMKNAADGYKNAGLSANEYMETVTGFSASLIASLNGDTVKAAEMSNKAIVDMADNANKMGTSMESIQNAYSGFAKQNYTMLDNLKLGYGGTKEEMQRLLEDAEKLSGMKFDISSFGDIVEAIHVVQKEMHISGITAEEAAEAVRNGTMTEAEALAAMGTTAKEAATTISGSLGMMKSSWANLITGVADDTQDFDKLIDNFVNSVDTVAKNIMPRVEQALNGVGKLVEALVPTIIERVPELLENTLPTLTNAVTTLMSTLGNTLVSNADTLLMSAIDLLDEVFQGLSDSSALGDGLSELIETLENRIPQIFGRLTSIGIELIEKIADGIIENTDAVLNAVSRVFNDLIESIGVIAPVLLDAGYQILVKIGEGIIENVPELIDTAIIALEDFAAYLADNASVMLPKLVKLVGDIAKMITDPEAIGKLVDVGLDIIMTLTDAILDSIPVLVDALPEIIQNIVTAITDNLPKLLDAGWDIVKAITEAIFANLPQIIDAGGQIIDSLGVGIVQAVMQLWDKFDEICTTIADLIIEAFKFAIDALKKNMSKLSTAIVKAIAKAVPVIQKYIKKAKTFGQSFIQMVITGIKSKLSNLLKTLKDAGENMISKFVNGIKNKFNDVKTAIASIIKHITDKFNETVKKAIDWGKDMISNLVSGVKNKINAVKQAIADVTKAIKDKFQETIDKAIDWGKDLIQKIIDGIKAKIQAIKDAVSDVKKAITEKFEEIINKAKEWGENTIGNFVDKLKEKWENIKNKVTEVKDAIAERFTDIVETAKTWGKRIISNVVDNIVSKYNDIKSKVGEITDGIRKFFTDLVDNAWQWGWDLIANFASGLFAGKDSEKQDSIKAGIRALGDVIRANIGFSEPKEGPLSNFHTYAPDMMALFSQGIRENAYMISDALDSTLYKMQSAFDLPHTAIGNVMTANNYAVPDITEVPRESAVYNEGDNIFNITVQAGTIANDYDANRAAQVMAERLAALQSQQRRAIGL